VFRRFNFRGKQTNKIRVDAVALFWLGVITLYGSTGIEAGGTESLRKAVTFNRDVAPIFYKSCAEGHRPGEAAPFWVPSYKDGRVEHCLGWRSCDGSGMAHRFLLK
jgi:hypothetical protein